MNGGALNNATIQAPRRTALAALPAFQALCEEAREKALDAFTQRSTLTGVSVEDLGKQLQDDPATLSFLLENF
jgi:hypothetical protein